MIDRQLLAAKDQKPPPPLPKNKSALNVNQKDSITHDIFHGGKIYLQNGNMAFKPVAMETVLEQVGQTGKRKKVKEQTTANKMSHYGAKARFTTEENIEYQQRLDYASAEDFLTFGKHERPQEINIREENSFLKSPEIHGPKTVALAAKMRKQKPQAQSVNDSISYKSVPAVSSMSMDYHFQKVREADAARHRMPEASRQVNPQLSSLERQKRRHRFSTIDPDGYDVKMTSMKQHQKMSLSPDIRGSHMVRYGSGTALQTDSSLEDEDSIGAKDVQINEVVAKLQHQVTGAAADEATEAKLTKAQYIKQLTKKLHEQSMKNTKEWVRAEKLAEQNEGDAQTLDVATVMEQPVPMPHRMRSNATFQPKNSLSLERPSQPSVLDDTKSVKVHDDRISRLANNYNMHIQNQEKMKSLLALLGPEALRSVNISDLDAKSQLEIDDSFSNLDGQSAYESIKGGDNKFPEINMRIQDQASDDQQQAASTLLGTNVRGSSHDQRIDILQSQMENYSSLQGLSQGLNESRGHNFRTLAKAKSSVEANKILLARNMLQREEASPMPMDQYMGRNRQTNIISDLNAKSKRHRLSKSKRVSMYDRQLHREDNLDTKSDFSVGKRSVMTRRYGHRQLDQQSAGYALRRVEFDDARSLRSQAHSNSSKKILYGGGTPLRKEPSQSLRAQSLQFNKGLTAVMVKGRAQPSEKYIFKQMLPYTAADKFSSVQVKSSNTRHNVLVHAQSNTVPTQNKTLPKKRAKKSKLRKQKTKESKQAAALKKKGIIVEMEEEYSQEGDVTQRKFFGQDELKVPSTAAAPVPYHEDMSWQELMEENRQMKDQILTQIAIFQQYLKVAALQHKQREEQEQRRKRRGSVSKKPLLGADFFEFDDGKGNRVANELNANARRHERRDSTKRPNVTVSHSRGSSLSKPIAVSRLETPISSRHASRLQSATSHGKSASSNRNRSKSRGGQSSNQLKSREPSKEQTTHWRQKSTAFKSTFVDLSKKVSSSVLKLYEHLLPMKGPKHTYLTSHTAHQHLLLKISQLWDKLNRDQNAECVRIQNEIARNKARINQLTRENLFELDANFYDQVLLMKVTDARTKADKRLKANALEKKLLTLQKRVRVEMDRHAELHTWGLNNYIIEFRIKVRMTEDLIDCAQRYQIKSDDKTARELDILKRLRDRTYDDLQFFITKRNERPWRNWDHKFAYYKPALGDEPLDASQLGRLVDLELLMIAVIEPKYAVLTRDIPPYNHINGEMIQFCTQVFGNDGWLQMFQMRQLRRLQDHEQGKKAFVPPVDHIRRHEVDPYTLQIDPVALQKKQDDLSQMNSAKATASVMRKKESAWEIRKPDQPGQGTLKTGYEPAIAARQAHFKRQADIAEDEEENPRIDTKIANHSASSKNRQLQPSLGSRQSSNWERAVKKDRNKGRAVAHVELHPVGGFGRSRFDGDVVSHLKKQADEADAVEQEQAEQRQVARSNWLQALQKEKEQQEEREAIERKVRAARLAQLFDENDGLSGDDEDMLDAGAAKKDVRDFIEKIDTHLQVEKRLLEAWNENDREEVGGDEQEGPKAKD